MKMHARTAAALAILVALAAGAAAESDYPRKVSDLHVVGDVLDYRVSPDEQWIVYRSDQRLEGVLELTSIPLSGGAAISLTGGFAATGGVIDYEISPDSRCVVFIADFDDPGRQELFSVPIEGGAPTRLSGGMISSGDVFEFQISPFLNRVVYRADKDRDESIELYSVPIFGGASTKLHPAYSHSGGVQEFAISPDAARVVYRSDQDTPGQVELYSAPLAGGMLPTRLNDEREAVAGFAISPDAAHVVYLSFDPGMLGGRVDELFSVPIDGGSPVRLLRGLVQGGAVHEFSISPDSTRVIYLADAETDELNELFSVPVGGGAIAKLNGPMAGDGVESDFQILPDSSRVIYRAEQDLIGVLELYSVALAGGSSAKLNEALAAGGTVTTPFRVSADASRVVYRVFPDPIRGFELHSVPAAGGASVLLSAPPAEGGEVHESLFAISPDSAWVTYVERRDPLAGDELFVAPLDGATAAAPKLQETHLNGSVLPGAELHAGGPEGSFVYFVHESAAGNVSELFRVPALDDGPPAKLNAPLRIDGTVTSSNLSPDSKWAVYVWWDGLFELRLYSVALDGGVSTRLDVPPFSGRIEGFEISPDSKVVVFGREDTGELYSVPIGGGTPMRLNSPAQGVVDSIEFQITPDSRRVVYQSPRDTAGMNELYSVRLAGGHPEVKLNGPLVAGGEVKWFEISADSERVVYRADENADDLDDLYSVLTDGREPRIKLTPSIGPAAVEVLSAGITPKSSRVIFQLRDQHGFNYLFEKPIEGGDAALVASESSRFSIAFKISPDSRHVVWRRLDDGTSQNAGLYSTNLSNGDEVLLDITKLQSAFVITPDGSRVLYVAEVNTEVGLDALVSVPTSGGSTVSVSGLLRPGAFVGLPLISPDSRWAVYRSDTELGSRAEVFSVRVDGQGGPVKLNEPLAPGATLVGPKISPDSSFVLLKESGGAYYRTPIGGGPSRRITPPGWEALFTRHISSDSRSIVFHARVGTFGANLFLWRDHATWMAAGGDWPDAQNWDDGWIPLETTSVAVGRGVTNVDGTADPVLVAELRLGGQDESAILQLSSGAVMAVADAFTLLPGGVVRGDGVLALTGLGLEIPAGASLRASLRAAEGEALVVASDRVSNAGTVEALGRALNPAEIEFSGPVTNEAGSGFIRGGDSTLRFGGGLANRGALSLTGTVNDLFGDIENEPGGSIVVSGGALAIFNDDVHNSSIINVSSAGGLQSVAVFFGALTGNGVSGGGITFIEGDSRPGFSPGSMYFGGDVSYGPLAHTEMEIAGPQPGTDHDQVVVDGHLTLGGTLEVILLDGFAPTAGMTFDLFDADSMSGEFASTSLPELPAGLSWHAGALMTEGELRVGLTPSSYGQFAAVHGLSGSPAGDSDWDGLADLFEYLAGLDPTAPDGSIGQPSLTRVGGLDHYSFRTTDPLGEDVLVSVETSTTLEDGSWTQIAVRGSDGDWTGPAVVEEEDLGAGLLLVTVLNQPAPRQFYRLRIELLP